MATQQRFACVLLIVAMTTPGGVVRADLKNIVLYQHNVDLLLNDKHPNNNNNNNNNKKHNNGDDQDKITSSPGVEDQIVPPSTSPRQPSPMAEYNRMNDKLLCKSNEQLDTWLRHPANCSRFFVCSGGNVREMKPCSPGKVFSIRTKRCVPANSVLDDCDEMIFSLPTHVRAASTNSTSPPGGPQPALVWHPQFSQQRDATPRVQLTPTAIMAADVADPKSKSFNPLVGCGMLRSGVFAHPDNCAWYFNCSVRPDAVQETFYNGHVMECPYPQLFSVTSRQCEDFEDVACRGRYEPKSPCDYRANHCHETSHCIPCWVRYASCLGMEDGLNPWPELEWRPFFVECYSQRTVFQGSCEKSSVFSPLTRACETPYSIPREHGGWRPSCQGRRDGKYPDEHGRCESYYACAGQIFTGFHSCQGSKLFDPVTGSCQEKSRVPYPCGDQDTPNFCHGKTDGKYLDAHGRCTHFYSCTAGSTDGVFMCPQGVFNPRTRTCEVNSQVINPCGSGLNPCFDKDDGYHSDDDADTCRGYYLCEKGLQTATFSCDGSKVFDDVTRTCSDVMETAPPCGLAPSCQGRADGKYPALNRGVSFFYSCNGSEFAGYSRCDREEDGGLAFSARRRRCDSPSVVCSEMMGSSEFC